MQLLLPLAPAAAGSAAGLDRAVNRMRGKEAARLRAVDEEEGAERKIDTRDLLVSATTAAAAFTAMRGTKAPPHVPNSQRETASSLEKGPSIVHSKIYWMIDKKARAAEHRAANIRRLARKETQMRAQGARSNATTTIDGPRTSFASFGVYPSPPLGAPPSSPRHPMRRCERGLSARPKGYSPEYEEHLTLHARAALKMDAMERAREAAEQAAKVERRAAQERAAELHKSEEERRRLKERQALQQEVAELRAQVLSEPKALLLL